MPILAAGYIMDCMDISNDLEWMLWQVDEEQRGDQPEENLIRAIQHYNDKYGFVPNRCEVAAGWAMELKAPPGMLVEPSRKLRPFHFLITLDPNMNAGNGAKKMIGPRKKERL
jgi:hypothetical protein